MGYECEHRAQLQVNSDTRYLTEKAGQALTSTTATVRPFQLCHPVVNLDMGGRLIIARKAASLRNGCESRVCGSTQLH